MYCKGTLYNLTICMLSVIITHLMIVLYQYDLQQFYSVI